MTTPKQPLAYPDLRWLTISANDVVGSLKRIRDFLQSLAQTVASIKAGTVTSVKVTTPTLLVGTPAAPTAGDVIVALSLASQSASTVFGGPASGSAAAPAFRSLVGADFGTRPAATALMGPTSGADAAPTWRSIANTDLPAALAPATSIAVGSGTALTGIEVYTPSLTPDSVTAGSNDEQSFAVTGLTADDKLVVNGPSGAAIVNQRADTDTLYLTFNNPTALDATPPAGTYTVLAFRS